MKKLIKKYLKYKTDQLSYATVCDFNDSVQNFSSICGLNGDLKNVQRPWVIKAILANVPLEGVSCRKLVVGNHLLRRY